MAALIDFQIPNQSFEWIQYNVVRILALELQNQIDLRGDTTKAKVFSERFAKIDVVDVPCVNVTFNGGPYDDQDVTVARGTYTYNIDLYTDSKSFVSGNERADQLAMASLQVGLGWIRAILQNAQYITLGFTDGRVRRRQVKSIQIATPEQHLDAQSIVMGRIVLEVVAPEVEGLIDTPVVISSLDTVMKLHDTEKGYYFISGDKPT